MTQDKCIYRKVLKRFGMLEINSPTATTQHTGQQQNGCSIIWRERWISEVSK